MSYRKVLFLEIDGILNDNSWQHDDTAPWVLKKPASHLNYILQKTDAKIILISQRRAALHSGRITLSGFQVLLKSHGIKANLAGYLNYSDNWEDKRFLIKDWLRVNTWKTYVVLDSTNMECDNQVFPNPKIGLSYDNAVETISILNGELNKKLVEEDPDDELGVELES